VVGSCTDTSWGVLPGVLLLVLIVILVVILIEHRADYDYD
jgi:hypothetical protein